MSLRLPDDVERYLSSCALNLPAYLAEEERLEREHRGECAVLHDSELVGVCETTEEADAKGWEVAESGKLRGLPDRQAAAPVLRRGVTVAPGT